MTYDASRKKKKKAKKKSGGKLRAEKALTLDDVFGQVAETATPSLSPSLTNVVLTPLSAEACLRHGINPEVLRERDFDSFWEPSLNVEVQRMRHEAYARRRHDLYRVAQEERAKLEEGEKSRARQELDDGTLLPEEILEQQERETSTLLENERRRIAKAKNRQKRELLQTLQFEQKLEEIQTAMREKAEKETQEEERRRKEKKKQDRRAAEERRIRELRRKAQEDMEGERARLLQQEQYERELKIQQDKERQEKEARKRAKMQELERARKAELHRLQSQHFLEQQRLELERKKQEREAKDRERQAKIEIKKALDQQEAAARRKEMDERLEANRSAAVELEEKRKQDLLDKKLHHDRIQEDIQADQERQKEEKRRQKKVVERKRSLQLKATRDREEAMKESLRKKFEDDEEYLAEYQEMREKELALCKEERLIREQLKKDNVERIRRMQEYRQLETMRKVEQNERRTDELIKKKQELLNQRRSAAREAKIQKDRIMSVLEQTKMGGGRSMKKMLAVLEADNGRSGKNSAKARSKKRIPSGSSLNHTRSEGSLLGSDSLDDLGPPPDAPSLLARLKSRGNDAQQVEPYISPYESTGAMSVANTL